MNTSKYKMTQTPLTSDVQQATDKLSIQLGEIWLLIDSLKFGGIETHVRELANALMQFKQPVRVVLLRRYEQPSRLASALLKLDLPYSYLEDLASQASLVTQLYRAVRYYKPALLHAHGYKASICARLIKLMTGIPQFSTYHAGETPSGKVWLYDWLDRYTSWLSSQSICVSHAIADKLPITSVIMNNFIAQPEPIDKLGKQIAFIGRLSHEKAPDRFMNLASAFPELAFHVYGDGPMYQRLTEQAPINVTLHGHVSDMQSHWHNIRLLVIPSRFEGLPMVSLEAMGRGIPVLATNVGALSKLIQHDVNGWIAQSPDQLIALMHQWLGLSLEQQRLVGQQAKGTISESYTDLAVIPDLLGLYRHHMTLHDPVTIA